MWLAILFQGIWQVHISTFPNEIIMVELGLTKDWRQDPWFAALPNTSAAIENI